MRNQSKRVAPYPDKALACQAVVDEPFTPVPRKTLSGWTPDRQRRFIAALAATGSVAMAAASVEMTREGAYLLRAAPGSAEFVAAWDKAVRRGIGALRAVAFDRAINGEAEPVYFQGEQVGERRLYNNQLLMRLLTHYDRQAAEAATRAASIDDPRPSSAAVSARLASKFKPIRSMNADDHRRNQQWMDYDRFNRAIGQVMLINKVRGWIADGGLDAIIAHLDHMERSTMGENQLLTQAMRDEIAATGTLAKPWLDSFAGLEALLHAECVEAAANAGVLPVW